jgi:hypothetical protein
MNAKFVNVLLAAVTLAGCASAGTTGERSNRNRITTEQLSRLTADNAYDAVRRLQPQWLESRGPSSVSDANPATPAVYLNGSRVGDVEYLRTVPLTTVAEIRYWTPGEASARFGMGLPRGVIELISKGAGSLPPS